MAPNKKSRIDDGVRLQSISKAYGSVRALRSVQLRIKRGEVVGLLGRNGAGKTTLLSIAAGLLSADRGKAIVNGHVMSPANFVPRRSIGFAPQDVGLYEYATVRENLSFFGRLAGIQPGPRLSRAVSAIAERLDLVTYLDRYPRHLSGGERRKLHVASAVLHGPTVVLLDEPTAGLDVDARHELYELVRELAANGAAVCYSTHYMEELEALNANVAILHNGRIVATGSRSELLARVDPRPVYELELENYSGSAIVLDRVESLAARDGQFRLRPVDKRTSISQIVRQLERRGHQVARIEVVKPSLETLFLEITGTRIDVG